MQKKAALILNPGSGGGRTKKHYPEIVDFLAAHKIDYSLFESKYHGHIVHLFEKISIDEYDAIVSIGGDGTNYHILNGLLHNHSSDQLPPICILPLGSGNSFAKDLKIESLSDGLRSLVSGNTRKVDVCSFSQGNQTHYFVNLAGLGFVTDVAKTASRFKIFKDFSYIIGVFVQTLKLKFHDMELEIDGRIINEKNCFVEFCNSRYTGGEMLMAPKAKIDDGLMDIIVAGKISRISLLKTLPKLFKGTHIEHPAVRYFKAKEAKIFTTPSKLMLPDGEIFGKTPATFKIHPGLVRYCI